MRESSLVRWAVGEMRAAGWYVVKTCPPIQAGTPDLLCSVPPDGRFVGVEMKAGKRGRVSRLQEYRLEEICRTGAVAVVCRTRNEVRDLIERLGTTR